jgi:micrococcal nuclease
MYEYKCKIRKVVDGDTVDIDIDLGFGVWLNDERVRIIGIDTPESRTSDPIEKKFGLAAKERVQHLLGEDATLISKVKGDGNEEMRGKFGRVLGDFRTSQGDLLTSKLMKEGHAVAYSGGNKEVIQVKHLENRQRLVNEGKVDVEGMEITKPALVQKPIVEETVVEEVSAPVKKTTKKKTSKKK